MLEVEGGRLNVSFGGAGQAGVWPACLFCNLSRVNAPSPSGSITTMSRRGFSTRAGHFSHSPRLLRISRTRWRTWRARSESVFRPHRSEEHTSELHSPYV